MLQEFEIYWKNLIVNRDKYRLSALKFSIQIHNKKYWKTNLLRKIMLLRDAALVF